MEEFLKNEKDIQDVLVACMRSTKTFAEVFFPERFFVKFSPLHDQIFDLIDSGEPKIVIAAPRGFGKTSIVGLALAAKKILFRICHLLMHISMSFDAAVMQTENLKHELLSNPMVKALFPPIKTRGAVGVDESFSKKAWVTSDSLIYPRGAGQQIRGILYHNNRPDMLVIDDLEDPETIANDEIRAKTKTWFHADVVECTSRVKKDWQFVYIDTLKHEDSLLQELLDSSDWASLLLEACDDELKPTAPDFMSEEDVRKKHAGLKEKGQLDVFYREFRNIPISLEDAVFKPEFFRYYSEEGDRLRIKRKGEEKDEIIQSRRLTNVILVDPAKTVKLQSAESAVGCIGVDRETRKIFVRDIVSYKMRPDELYDEMFKLVRTYNAMVLGVEVTSLHLFISQPIQNEMIVRGIYPIYLEMKASGHKEDRIAKLAPFYKLGYMYHNLACCDKLEAQLMGFPRSKYWDVMDMLSYIIYVMDKMAYYFDPEETNEEDIEKEFAELEDDMDMPGEDDYGIAGRIWQPGEYARG